MEGSFKPQGSIGVPPKMLKEMEEARKTTTARQQRQAANPGAPKDADEQVLQGPPPEALVEVPSDKPTDASREKEFLDIRAGLEKSLGATIDAADVKAYIFKGVLSKEVELIPGVVKGTFKTITPEQFMEIDERMYQYQNEMKFTQMGIDNHRAILNLSYAWTHADGKPLSSTDDAKKREGIIRKMGAHLVDAATNRMNDFNYLVRLVLQEKNFIKK